MLPNNTSLTVGELKDVRQLEGLFRAHTLLAQVAGRASQHYTDYLLMAYAYLLRIWHVSCSLPRGLARNCFSLPLIIHVIKDVITLK